MAEDAASDEAVAWVYAWVLPWASVSLSELALVLP
jgi:hypothetical protein